MIAALIGCCHLCTCLLVFHVLDTTCCRSGASDLLYKGLLQGAGLEPTISPSVVVVGEFIRNTSAQRTAVCPCELRNTTLLTCDPSSAEQHWSFVSFSLCCFILSCYQKKGFRLQQILLIFAPFNYMLLNWIPVLRCQGESRKS